MVHRLLLPGTQVTWRFNQWILCNVKSLHHESRTSVTQAEVRAWLQERVRRILQPATCGSD